MPKSVGNTIACREQAVFTGSGKTLRIREDEIQFRGYDQDDKGSFHKRTTDRIEFEWLQAPGQGRTQRANSVWIPAQQFQIELEIAMVPRFKEKMASSSRQQIQHIIGRELHDPVSSIEQCTVYSHLKTGSVCALAAASTAWKSGLRRGPLCEGEKDNLRTGAVPFHFARLRAKGRSRFDVAEDGGEDLIESAAVELEKLLDR